MVKRLFPAVVMVFALYTPTFAADTTIKGTTSDSSAASLEVTNSADTSLLFARNDGNIGVGINAPTKKLHVSGGDVRIDNMTTAGFVKNDVNGILSGGNTVGSFVGGSDAQVQFNDGGSAFGGATGLTYNKTTTTATIATLNLTNALGLAYGGTGAATQAGAANNILPSQTGNAGKFLATNGTDAAWQTVTASPGGSDTQVQFNNGGALAGAGGLTYNTGTGATTIGSGGTAIAKIMHGTVSVDPPNISNNQTATFTVTITGAATTDCIFLTPPSAIENLIFEGATITSADTVTIKLANESGGAINGSDRTWCYLIVN